SGERAAALSAPADIRFEYRNSDGLQAVKEFHFEPAGFIVGFRAAVSNGDRAGMPSIVWGPAVGDIAEGSRYTTKAGGLLFQDSKVGSADAAATAKQPAHEGEFKYAGVDDNYFMTAALYPGASKVTFQPVAVPPADPKGTPRELVSYSIELHDSDIRKFFVGPKDFDQLTMI